MFPSARSVSHRNIPLSALGQSASKYQVGTIAAVKPHQPAGEARSDALSYGVSLRVGDTVYAVLLQDLR